MDMLIVSSVESRDGNCLWDLRSNWLLSSINTTVVDRCSKDQRKFGMSADEKIFHPSHHL